MKAPARATWPVRVAGLATVAVFLLLVGRFWHPAYEFTKFIQLDASNDELKLPPFRELPVYVYRDTGGYDGLYYAQLALDPTLRDPALPRAMDNFSYRARRILPSALAWLAGGGRPRYVIAAYTLVNVAAWLVLAALLWFGLPVRDGRSWAGWAAILGSAGALCSVRLALTDLPATVLLCAALLAAERERKRTALACLGTACLARETAFLAVTGLTKRPWASPKNAIRIALSLLPLAAWMLYVRWRVGPADAGWGNFTWPFAGFVEKWQATVHAVVAPNDPWLAWTTLLATAGVTFQALFVIVRRDADDRWWRVAAAYVLLLAMLGTAVWEGFPGAFTRVLLPLTLAFNVLIVRWRAPKLWFLLGNLSVAAGLLALRDVPSDPRELAAARSGETAAIVRIGGGWYDHEQSSRHSWMWARQAATLEITAWPRGTAHLRLTFGVRSLSPRTLKVRAAGREIWHGNIGTNRSVQVVACDVTGGRAELEFSSDEPPVREQAANPREVAFALYDLQVAVTKR